MPEHGIRIRVFVSNSAALNLLSLVLGLFVLTTSHAARSELEEEPPLLEGEVLAVPLELLGETVLPGTLARLEIRSSETFSGTRVDTPVAVVHGRLAGPRLCIIAGIHGDEVNGVEVVRRVIAELDPESLRGTVVAVPIANLSAFRRGSRYLPDRRDLNRFFPGRANGSSASRIAYGLFENVVRHCEGMIDLHTGSFHRSNLHQLRANLVDLETAQLSVHFGPEIVVNSAGRIGTLRRAATDAGIPTITVEAGESARFNEAFIIETLKGIQRLLVAKGMVDAETPNPPPLESIAFLRTRWVRCDQGGILVSRVGLGDEIEVGQVLGTISDPLSDKVAPVVTPIRGRVLGMALDQVVMPGFAAFHIGYDAHPLAPNLWPATSLPEVASEEDPDGLDLEDRPE